MTFSILYKPIKNEEVLYWIRKLNNFGVIAGGAARACYEEQPVRDIDIFPLGSTMEEATDSFIEICRIINDGQYTILFDNPLLSRFVGRVDSVTGDPISEITIDVLKPRDDRWMKTFGSPESIISKFDFTVCRIAIVSDTKLLADPKFEKDLESKKLRIENIVCPISTVKRIAKYGQKGYTISASQTIKLFNEWEDRPTEEKLELYRLLRMSEQHIELTTEDLSNMMSMLYVD